MTAAAAILTPFDLSKGSSDGQVWWKRLLPVGEINYKGRTLNFTRDYLSGLAQAFRDGAYDQVPFQLAGDDNKHTNDVERYGGKVADMQLRGDGLWIGVQPTARGRAVLEDNDELGVSARIVEAYDRADGKFFPKAIQHVLATLDPRVPGLGRWQAVETSNDDAATITYDLSGETFAGSTPPKGDTMPDLPDLTEAQRQNLAALLEIPADQLSALATKLSTADLNSLTGGQGSPAPAPAPAPAGDGLLSDAELDALVDQALAMDAAGLLDDEDVPEGEPAGAGLTAEQQMAIELAQATGDEAHRQLGIIGQQLDHERWLNERRKLINDAGCPPFIADLAQPLLEGSAHTVDLANGSTVDAGQVVRRIITEFGKITSQLGFDVELGTPVDEPDDAGTAAEARNDIVARAKAQMGLV